LGVFSLDVSTQDAYGVPDSCDCHVYIVSNYAGTVQYDVPGMLNSEELIIQDRTLSWPQTVVDNFCIEPL